MNNEVKSFRDVIGAADRMYGYARYYGLEHTCAESMLFFTATHGLRNYAALLSKTVLAQSEEYKKTAAARLKRLAGATLIAAKLLPESEEKKTVVAIATNVRNFFEANA